MTRTPWFALAAATMLLVSSMDGQLGYHTPRTAFRQPQKPVTVASAFLQWRDAAEQCWEGAPGGAPKAIPMVFVAAPGGGARAAYWTALAMRGIARADRCAGGSVFAASGVSGGSVGLATWAATGDAAQTAVEDLTTPDALAADIAGLLFRDTPRAFVGIHPWGVDRAAVEEDVWTTKVPELNVDFSRVGGTAHVTKPLPVPRLEPPRRAGLPEVARWSPLLLLNSSDLATGCKLLVTNLKLRPSGRSVTDCRAPEKYDKTVTDVALGAGTVNASLFSSRADCSGRHRRSRTLASAALLSARFPFVSPTGQLARCIGPGSTPDDRVYAGDGGYLENSGLHTVLALWADLRATVEASNAGGAPHPTVVPMVVLLDNHFRATAAVSQRPKLGELVAPVEAKRRGLLDQAALEQATRAVFTAPVPGVVNDPGTAADDVMKLRRWFVLAPTDRPQVAAPLGWSLSDAARSSLSCQLDERLQADAQGCPKGLPNRDDTQVGDFLTSLEQGPPLYVNN